MVEPVKRWQSLAPYLILMALAFIAYANTFGNGWTYDDFPVIVENPDIRSWGGFLKNSYPGRPLRELTYLFDHALFGLNPAGWHLQQIFWHGLNACLVYLLGRRLQLASWAALFAALLFLLHPLQVEVVANLSHRKDSLALAGSLGTILFYLQFLQGERRRLLALSGAVLCFVLAFSAKQTAVMVPVVCLLSEYLLVAPTKRVMARSPWLLAGAAALVFMLAGWGWVSVGGWQALQLKMQDTLSFKANYFADVTFFVYYLTVLKSWVFLGARLFLPLELALEYTFPVADSLFDPWVLVGMLLLLSGLAFAWWSSRHRPAACWLLLSGMLFFLPTANLWPLTYLAADRYLYAPLAFLALLAGLAMGRCIVQPKVVILPALVLLLCLATLTWQQNRVWMSPETLWEKALQVSPESSFALNNMGNLALQENRVGEAEKYYRRSVQVNPLNPTAHYNLGWLAERRRNLPQALEHYRAFARLNHPVFRKQLQALREHLLSRYGVQL